MYRQIWEYCKNMKEIDEIGQKLEQKKTTKKGPGGLGDPFIGQYLILNIWPNYKPSQIHGAWSG